MTASGLRVDTRGELVPFRFEGRRLEGVAGEPIAAALHAAGVRTLSRSFKYNRPRGLHCVADACPNCAMRVNGLPGVTTCVTPLRAGDVVDREHAWPDADSSVLGIADAAGAALGAGFQFRHLRRAPAAFHRWERILARLAGHGRLPDDAAAAAMSDRGSWTIRDVDVTVVGGGAAGLAAALAAEAAGAEVLLIERDRELGGWLLAGDPDERARVSELTAQVRARPGVQVLAAATAIGSYDDAELGVVTETGFVQVHTRRVVLATGTLEDREAPVDGDRPGVFLGGGAQRLLHRHGVLAGRRPIVATNEDYGYALAVRMARAGAEVSCVVDARPNGEAATQDVAAAREAGISILSACSVQRVIGKRGVQRVVVSSTARQIEGDALLIAAGRRPELGLLRQRAGTCGGADDPSWQLAGGAAGAVSAEQAIESGCAAGEAALRGGPEVQP